jgi:toxin-antitoxin system PIN domain toxin
MWLADSNVWLALTLSGHEFHGTARTWFHGATKKDEVAFCRPTQLSFVRLLTTPAVLKRFGAAAYSNREAWKAYDQLTAANSVTFVSEPAGVESYWKKFTDRSTASPNLWMDAYLASFAVAGKLRLVTTDRGFRQFSGLDFHVIEK